MMTNTEKLTATFFTKQAAPNTITIANIFRKAIPAFAKGVKKAPGRMLGQSVTDMFLGSGSKPILGEAERFGHLIGSTGTVLGPVALYNLFKKYSLGYGYGIQRD
jgi:hypothetical protein